MAWIESHQELREHPKTKRLCRALALPRPTVVGYLHFLWWWAYDYAPEGDLSQFTDEDIADAIDWDGDPGALVAALMQSGFIDDTRRLHDWSDFAHRGRQRSPMRRAWEAMARRLRPLILQRDGHQCRACGAERGRLEIDHIIPIAWGGNNDPANLQVLCFLCNRAKGARWSG